jgi:hypothetical protein
MYPTFEIVKPEAAELNRPKVLDPTAAGENLRMRRLLEMYRVRGSPVRAYWWLF